MRQTLYNANENVIITYFAKLSTTCRPSSIWAFDSMIRTMKSIKMNIDISKCTKLVALLKRKIWRISVKKSRVLTTTDITGFLVETDERKPIYESVTHCWSLQTRIGIVGNRILYFRPYLYHHSKRIHLLCIKSM